MSVGLGAWLLCLALCAARWAFGMHGHVLRSTIAVSVTVAVYLHPTVTSTTLKLLDCQAAVLTDIARAGLDGGAGDAAQVGATPQRLTPVNLLVSNPYISCFQGSHLPAGALAAATLGVCVVGLPLLTFWWLWRDPQRRGVASAPGELTRQCIIIAPYFIAPPTELQEKQRVPAVSRRNPSLLRFSVEVATRHTRGFGDTLTWASC